MVGAAGLGLAEGLVESVGKRVFAALYGVEAQQGSHQQNRTEQSQSGMVGTCTPYELQMLIGRRDHRPRKDWPPGLTGSQLRCWMHMELCWSARPVAGGYPALAGGACYPGLISHKWLKLMPMLDTEERQYLVFCWGQTRQQKGD